MSQVNAAYRTPDVLPYEKVVAQGCDTCVSGRTHLEAMISAGRRAESDIWSATASRVLTWGGGAAVLDVRIEQHRVAILDAQGRKVDENVERPYRFELTISRVGGSWRVTKWLNIQN